MHNDDNEKDKRPYVVKIKWATPKEIVIAITTATAFCTVLGAVIWAFDTVGTVWMDFFINLLS